MTIPAPRLLPLLLGTSVMAGCNAYPTVEGDFGNSVRHMIASQTANPGPTDDEPVRQGDGQRADNVLGVYRSDVTPAQQTPSQNVVLDLGSALPR